MILEKRTQGHIDQKLLKQLSTTFSMKEEIVKLMFLRGINTHDKIYKFLNPDINNLYDPFLFDSMEEVTKKINQAIEKDKQLLIFGDYDVDGMSATAIMYLYLKSRGAKVNYFLPNRYIDEYGLTKGALDKIKKLYNPDLIITVDCGITAVEEVEYAKSLGFDILITDHHEVPNIRPNCPIINPKIKGQAYPYAELCGAGVSLKVVQALGGIEAAEEYLDIAALATIADIVDLTDENRLIVQLGLAKMQSTAPEGLKMLLKELKLGANLTSTEIAFKVAPKINAAGRMGKAEEGLKLLIEKDRKKLAGIVKHLLELNTLRQDLCQKVYDDCIEKLDKVNLATQKIIVLADKNWDAGLLGITAARLADEFNKPTILFSHKDGKYKGSARSIDGIDIHKAISCITAPIEAFGGHTMAAGLTIDEANFFAFTTQLKDCMAKLFDASFFYPKKYYDMELSPSEVDFELLNEIELLAPFGHNNALPIFNLSFEEAKVASMKNFAEHLTITFDKNFGLLNFYGGNHLLNYAYYKQKNALIELQKNTFRTKESIRGIVKNIAFSKLDLRAVNGFVRGNYLQQLFNEKIDKTAAFESFKFADFENLVEETFKTNDLGNLIVFSNVETYKKYQPMLQKYTLQTHLFEVGNKLGLNGVVIGLNSFANLNSFNNIIFADAVLSQHFLDHLSNNTKAKLFVHSIAYRKHDFKISTTREVFGVYFNVIKHAARQKLVAQNIYFYFNLLKSINKQISNFNYVQFLACTKVFAELKIIEEVSVDGNYTLRLNKQVQSSLEHSYIYNQLNAR